MNSTPGQKSLHQLASSSEICGPIEAIRNRMMKPDINVECPPEILRDCSAMHLDHKYHQKVFFYSARIKSFIGRYKRGIY